LQRVLRGFRKPCGIFGVAPGGERFAASRVAQLLLALFVQRILASLTPC
jgi:hypothetical protein